MIKSTSQLILMVKNRLHIRAPGIVSLSVDNAQKTNTNNQRNSLFTMDLKKYQIINKKILRSIAIEAVDIRGLDYEK